MCTRDSTYQNRSATQPITNRTIINKNITGTNCRLSKSFYPSFSPTISTLSVTTSVHGNYSLVYILGSNFLPPCYGTTYVNFGSFKNLPITFYSPFNISFVVPLNAPPGIYNVTVVNLYNGNFSPAVNQSYPGNQNYSNTITYTIT
jgi:hypothetical protein